MRRVVLVMVLTIAAAFAVVWSLRGGDDAADCRAGDLACVEAFVSARTQTFAEAVERLDDAASSHPDLRDDLCSGVGVAVARSAASVDDLVLLLEGFDSSACAPMLVASVVDELVAVGVVGDDLVTLMSTCSVAAGAVLPVCGEAVGALSGALEPGDAALGRCTGLREAGRVRCFATVLSGSVVDVDPADRTAALAETCAAWPLDVYAEECLGSAADAVFASVVLSLGSTGDITAGERRLVEDTFAFCGTAGTEAEACLRRGSEILVDSGRAGPVGSPRRQAVCDRLPPTLQEFCGARAQGPTGLVDAYG